MGLGVEEGGEVNTTGLWKLKGPDRPGIKVCEDVCLCVSERGSRDGRMTGERERERLTLHIHSHPLTAYSNKWILTQSEGGGWRTKKRTFKAGAAPFCCYRGIEGIRKETERERERKRGARGLLRCEWKCCRGNSAGVLIALPVLECI